jgi:AAA family ATP:ADP antiporter
LGEHILNRLISVRENETRATILAFLYFFCLLAGYYTLRPLREEMGLAGGVRNLPWMFQATLVATLLMVPVFGWCAQKFPRHVLLPIVYRAAWIQLLGFWGFALVLQGNAEIWLGRVFYVWLSVFNMFVVSVFWAFLSDGFAVGQSKRLFGLIAAGGSLGAIVGAWITAGLVDVVGRVHLFLFAVAFLELAVQCIRRLHHEFERMRADDRQVDVSLVTREREAEREAWKGPLGGALNGIGLTVKSSYLVAISGFLFFYSLCSTFLYFEQANIVAEAFESREARAATFAKIDLWVNVLTLATQIFLSGRIIRRIGIGATLVLLPILTAIGFAVLGFAPVLAVLVVFQVLRRASNYALIRPARETLFTTVSREERFKAKNFIDTFVYRGGDSLGSLAFDGLTRLGLGMGGIAFVAVPVAGIWGLIGIWLGRKQSRMVHETA